MTQTYALFDDGSASPIVFDFFSPEPADEPMRLACIGIQDRQVVLSAQMGCLAAYHALRRRGDLRTGTRLFPSCQFGDATANLRASGNSAGLAFCLKLAREVQRLNGDEAAEASAVAATGVIENGSWEARVGRVECIGDKLRGALHVLEPGDMLFAPSENQSEITEDLRLLLAERQIQLLCVGTVEEALNRLLPRPAGRQDRWHLRVMAVAVSVSLLAALLWRSSITAEADLQAVRGWCEQGEYGRAMAHLAESLDDGEDGADVARLYRQLRRQLAVDVYIEHLPKASQGMRPQRASFTNQGVLALAEADMYRLVYSVDDTCYAYVLLLADDDRVRVLSVPSPDGVATIPTARLPDRSYHLPEATDTWFRVGSGSREWRIYVIASRMRARDLERALREFERAEQSRRRQHVRNVLASLSKRREAQSSMDGVFYGELALRTSTSGDVR